MVNKAYEDLLETQVAYRNAYVNLNNQIIEYFATKFDEDIFKVIVDEFNFVIIRSGIRIDEETLYQFCEEFNCFLAWTKDEIMCDYRNVDEVSVCIYEYAFLINGLGDKDDRNASD